MRLADLPIGRVVPLLPGHWAWARLLGEARTAANAGRRAVANRGTQAASVDLCGALAELLVLGYALRAGGGEDMRRALLLPSAPSGADLATEDGAVDVKGHDLAPRKRLVALNARKHRALRDAGCRYYVVVFAPPLGRRAAVSLPVPLEDADRWPVAPLGIYGDPSHNLPIDDFARRYLPDAGPLHRLRGDVFAPIDVDRATVSPRLRERYREVVGVAA